MANGKGTAIYRMKMQHVKQSLLARLPKRRSPVLSCTVFTLLALPLVLLVWSVVQERLGPDPAEALMHSTGEWATRFLVLVLLARPLAQWGWPLLFAYRRMLGLWVFAYASLHALVFAQVYVGWDAVILAEELVERPYVWVGATAWLLLLPMAITSTQAWRRRLRQHWRRLHRAIYGVAIAVFLHMLWLARSDIGDALIYGALFVALLLWRLKIFRQRVLRAGA